MAHLTHMKGEMAHLTHMLIAHPIETIPHPMALLTHIPMAHLTHKQSMHSRLKLFRPTTPIMALLSHKKARMKVTPSLQPLSTWEEYKLGLRAMPTP